MPSSTRTSTTRARRLAAAVGLAALVLAGCSSQIAGTPVAAGSAPLTTSPPMSETAPPTTTAPSMTGPSMTGPSMGPVTTSGSSEPPEVPSSSSSASDGSTTSTTSSDTAPSGSASPMLVHGETISRPAVPSGPPVIVVVRDLPTSYDPNNLSGSLQTQVAALTLPSPYFIDPLGHLALDTDVVQRVAFGADPQKVEYHINPKATWSDGVAVSCQDFYLAWLANTSKVNGSGDPSGGFDTYGDVDYQKAGAPRCSDGGRTVTVTFSAPESDWQLFFRALLPAHIVMKAANVSDLTRIKASDTSAPVLALAKAYRTDFGTIDPVKNPSAGPYALESASDTSIVLKRNPTWWGHPAGPSAVRLQAQSDEAVAVQTVLNGDASVTSMTAQNLTVLDSLRDLEGVTRTNQTWPAADHIEFNLHDKAFTGKTGDAMRQAVFRCVDRTAIVNTVVHQLDPTAKPLGNMLVQPWDPGYTDHYRDIATANVAKAKSLMQQGSWTLGKDGVYAHGSTKAQFTLAVLPNQTREAAAKMIQNQCAKAGITIKIGKMTATDLLDKKFQAVLFGWSGTVVPIGNADIYSTHGQSNLTGFSNKTVDSLFDQISSDVKTVDQSKRLNEIDKLVAASYVMLPLFNETAVNLQDTRIHTTVTNNYFWGGVVWDVYAWTETD